MELIPSSESSGLYYLIVRRGRRSCSWLSSADWVACADYEWIWSMILSPQRPYDIDQVCLHRIIRDGLRSKGNSWNLWESTVQHWLFYLLILNGPSPVFLRHPFTERPFLGKNSHLLYPMFLESLFLARTGLAPYTYCPCLHSEAVTQELCARLRS